MQGNPLKVQSRDKMKKYGHKIEFSLEYKKSPALALAWSTLFDCLERVY